MNKKVAAVLLSLSALSSAGGVLANESATLANAEELKAEARQVIQTLAQRLGSELKAAAQQGGLPAAIEVCNTKAIPLTDDVSGMQGWEIGRTSLKLRNPENAPDAWERQVLEQFAVQAEQGADLKKLAYSEVVTDAEGRKTLRLMKAIPVAEQCLACHGDNLKPEVSTALEARYPHDAATGFRVGDLRGAFTLQKPL